MMSNADDLAYSLERAERNLSAEQAINNALSKDLYESRWRIEQLRATIDWLTQGSPELSNEIRRRPDSGYSD